MDTSSLLKELNDANTKSGFGSREEMLALAYSLVASLETPSEIISRIGWTEVSLHYAYRKKSRKLIFVCSRRASLACALPLTWAFSRSSKIVRPP